MYKYIYRVLARTIVHTFVFVTTFCNSSLRRRGLGAFALRTFGWRLCQSSGWRISQFAAFEVGDWADSICI